MKTEAEIQHDRIHGVEPKNETTARRVPRYLGQQTSMSDIVAERGDDARFCGAGRDPIQKGGYCPYHQKVASGGMPSPPRNPRKMIAVRA